MAQERDDEDYHQDDRNDLLTGQNNYIYFFKVKLTGFPDIVSVKCEERD